MRSYATALPLPIKFPDNFFWRQVEIDFGGCQLVMPQDLLQGSGGNTFLDTGHSESMPQYVECDGSADMRSVSNVFVCPGVVEQVFQ
jgi:hypothetical protein